ARRRRAASPLLPLQRSITVSTKRCSQLISCSFFTVSVTACISSGLLLQIFAVIGPIFSPGIQLPGCFTGAELVIGLLHIAGKAAAKVFTLLCGFIGLIAVVHQRLEIPLAELPEQLSG